MPRLSLTLLFLCLSAPALAKVPLEIRLLGIEGELADNAKAYLSLAQQKDHPLLNETRLRRLHDKAPQEIRSALKPFGYYRAQAEGRLYRGEAGVWIAEYQVSTGPPLPVAELELTLVGAAGDDPVFAQMLKNAPLKQGETFDHRRYEELKALLSRLAAERGYFDARFLEHVVEVDLEKYQARVYLYYDSGERYDFGPVQLEQDVLHPGLMNRYITFREGDPYDVNALLELQQNLNDSDYFSTVEVSPEELPAQGQIPVNINLTPRKRHRFSLGLGYGSDAGARARLGWEMPRLNRRGHRFDMELKGSESSYSFKTRYRVPVLDPVTDQIVYAAGQSYQLTKTSESTLRTLSASLDHSTGPWRESISLNYQAEHYRVADDIGRSVMLFPSINRNRVWSDSRIFALSGLRIEGGLRGTIEQFISNAPFLQGRAAIKGIMPMGNGRFIGRWEGGMTWTDSIHKLPASIRFFAGGAQSVRGYAYHSLGPKNNAGEVIGGRHLLVGSIEYDYPIGENWGIAAFWDKGNAMDDLETPLMRGAGFGLRWKSPVGPIRFDLAWALSYKDRPWELHINIGPDL